MEAAEDTEETTQNSTRTHTETHSLTSLVPVAVVHVGYNALMLTQCFPATLHMRTLLTFSTEPTLWVKWDMKGAVQQLNAQLGEKLSTAMTELCQTGKRHIQCVCVCTRDLSYLCHDCDFTKDTLFKLFWPAYSSCCLCKPLYNSPPSQLLHLMLCLP